jgi:hypothetical protein
MQGFPINLSAWGSTRMRKSASLLLDERKIQGCDVQCEGRVSEDVKDGGRWRRR